MPLAEVTSHDELRAILGAPTRAVMAKERTFLSDLDKQWLAASPFCLVATSGADGTCDVSPKGDPSGFTLVLDDTTIVVPERPGNRRADGFTNILDNPHIGLIYLVPGRSDTLRINGRARIVRDAPFFEQMTVKGHRPQLALVVDVEQVFYHCSKALLRSALWSSETWDPTAVPSQAAIAKQTTRRDQSLEELERYYGAEYATRLYTG
ncbi:pyridoxamine 5'-phosphate oxidase family protein [Micromonospora polyrhachis]|uniref:pyridoxamine 5'-phosphate oxidase family protein n=1 Tax=Micromonospora polyrhachis TaxID=1282883 RepID=UPI0028AA0347|nr:pyridoxamine 5'-phosphate oxidase family protein [Micromonospora polyrhachis]